MLCSDKPGREEQEDHNKIQSLVKEGHSLHCAQRQIWGDGECEPGCPKFVEVYKK